MKRAELERQMALNINAIADFMVATNEAIDILDTLVHDALRRIEALEKKK